jgi:tyrosyl-tRNA synthetase
MKNKEKFVLTTRLLEDDKGHKMSKSEGNVVWLSDTAENIFGKVMSWPDGLIGIGLELCTKLSMEEVARVYKQLKNPKINPRDLKSELAYEITKIIHGEKAAQKAQENFERVFSKREAPKKVVTTAATIGATMLSVMTGAGLAESNADAKRKIKQGGVKIDSGVIDDIGYKFKEEDNGKILKVGKKNFRKIKMK